MDQQSSAEQNTSGPSPSYFSGVFALGQNNNALPSSPFVSETSASSVVADGSYRDTAAGMSSDNIAATSSSSRNPQDAVGSDGNMGPNNHQQIIPSISRYSDTTNVNSFDPQSATSSIAITPITTNRKQQSLSRRSRRPGIGNGDSSSSTGRHRRRRRRPRKSSTDMDIENAGTSSKWCCCKEQDRKIMVRSTLSCMNFVAKVLLWSSVIAMVAAVVWYSYELKNNGKDPHLIAWFSAGAFVLLGFPISLYGIVMHLANYNQPETQSYIVRILWMVPIYSIESWLCLRYKDYAIYIETLRDLYESYVLYSFLQYLIHVLGGEEALVLMLKDKSPTRGVHMWGLQWCVKPWLMGQPVRRTYLSNNDEDTTLTATSPTAVAIATVPSVAVPEAPLTGIGSTHAGLQSTNVKPLKRVHWTSPFFVKCKFGVLQYVLLKFVCSLAILILERYGWYKEGNFTYKGGYLYTCVLTNLSQCWALYCLIFFYYATKNELAPIRPVGKFLSVKALVFFTWWQSVGISMLYQMDLIPHYQSGSFGIGTQDDVMGNSEPDWTQPMSAEDALAMDQYGGNAFWPAPASGAASKIIDYTPEDVAKGMQDYLICIEMFVAAIVHIFVFPHSEYTPEAVEARARALNQMPNKHWNKRLGRKWKEWDNKSAWSGTTSNSRDSDIELLTMNQKDRNRTQMQPLVPDSSLMYKSGLNSMDEDDLMVHPMDALDTAKIEKKPLLEEGEDDDAEDSTCSDDDYDDDDGSFEDDGDEEQVVPVPSPTRPIRKKNFVSALLDSTIPQDLRDNTVGIIKGDYVVERKTLLHHAATSDSYDLFTRFPRRKGKTTPKPSPQSIDGSSV